MFSVATSEVLLKMNVEEVESARGKSLYRVDEFMYEVEKTREGKLFCRCIRKKKDNCLARAVIIKDPHPIVVKMNREHNHGDERRDRIMRTVRVNMKKTALSRPDKTIREVYNEVLAKTAQDLQPTLDPEELDAALPQFSGVRSAIQRTRAKFRSRLSASLADLTHSQEGWTTIKEEQFPLLNDSSSEKILGL